MIVFRYKLKMPSDVIEEGKLSALQLESIVYSCQQHNQFLEDGNRAGKSSFQHIV